MAPLGIGGSTPEQALARLHHMTGGARPIGLAEYQQRISQLQGELQAQGLAGVYAHAGSNLAYFTGLRWSPSERMVAAWIPAQGAPCYLLPAFEEGTVRGGLVVPGALHGWHEHESPYALFARVAALPEGARVGLCDGTPFYVFDALQAACPTLQFVSGAKAITACRAQKSAAELALMQCAKNMTMEVHKAAASILHEGITTTEVENFIELAHRKVGASGSYFVIVLFGEATQYPHGVKDPQTLKKGDVVLIDTGCKVHGYISDITRTYVFGDADAEQRRIWAIEKEAQAAAFAAAQIGVPCEEVDNAARRVLAAHGLGPDYALPGLPHRTGHGIGIDIHEAPYLVRGNRTPLAPGMCFSNEPMICVPGKFGIRLEDHFYMTENGPKWFTLPSHSIDDPFGLQAHSAL